MSKSIKDSIRLDQALVRKGLVPSRSKAKELILGGNVQVQISGHSQIIKDPAFEVAVLSSFEAKIINNDLLKYVSRSGLKLEGALRHIDTDSLIRSVCMDAGQSTGGFSQVLVEFGAERVIGFDVGHGQLHPHVRELTQVESFEGVNAREATQHKELCKYVSEIDLLVGDISFISFKVYVDELSKFLKRGGRLLFLIKPQFELNRAQLNKKGVVKDKSGYLKIKIDVSRKLEEINFEVLDYFESCVRGQDGNREFFIYAKKN